MNKQIRLAGIVVFLLYMTGDVPRVHGQARALNTRVSATTRERAGTLAMTKDRLKDKIMGGWAGQTIGVTFGGPYEFRYLGEMIPDTLRLAWYDGYLKKTMLEDPGLYDDLYMDLSFVEVMERLGPDAPVDSFAAAFAKADYPLWHANQSARYNILNGISAPLSGNWVNNPHADDIDFQIEADFSGLMSPGMPNTASAIGDRIGHIMNYGDGWYGGVFVGAMYALAFESDNIDSIVQGALRMLPARSSFYRCIDDVIRWHRLYPTDWHRTWKAVQQKWSSAENCPDGVLDAFDIDAKINAAYVVMGLLYGGGDYSRTLEVATRAGQDADCNPSTAGGILGTVLGYKKIPAYWKMGLAEAESIDFKYTSMSLHKVYETGYRHALETIRRNGGTVSGDMVTIRVQRPKAVRWEQSFPGMRPMQKKEFVREDMREETFDFEGTGVVVRGEVVKKKATVKNGAATDGVARDSAGKDTAVKAKEVITDFVFKMEVIIDAGMPETVSLPASFTVRRNDLCWKYSLPAGKHTVRMKLLNPSPDFGVNISDYVVYGKGE